MVDDHLAAVKLGAPDGFFLFGIGICVAADAKLGCDPGKHHHKVRANPAVAAARKSKILVSSFLVLGNEAPEQAFDKHLLIKREVFGRHVVPSASFAFQASLGRLLTLSHTIAPPKFLGQLFHLPLSIA